MNLLNDAGTVVNLRYILSFFLCLIDSSGDVFLHQFINGLGIDLVVHSFPFKRKRVEVA